MSILSPQQKHAREQRIQWVIAFVVVLVPALAMGGCAMKQAADDSALRADIAAKYTSSWDKSNEDTTCSDYTDRMDDHERWVLAADMLGGIRQGRGLDLPSDSTITAFQGEVLDACTQQPDALDPIHAAVGIFTSEPEFAA